MEKRVIDCVVANVRPVSPEVAQRYSEQGAAPVTIDRKSVAKLKVKLVTDDLLEEHGVIRHNSQRLARLLVERFLFRGKRR